MTGYALLILLGAALLSLPVSHAPGVHVGLVDALFTAASAASVTGLAVVETASSFSLFGHLVILFLIQVGGVGVMASVTIFAVLLGWRIGLRHRQLVGLDLNQFSIRGVVRLSIRVIVFTLALEAAGALVMLPSFARNFPPAQAAFYAVFHAVSAFCGAGLDLLGDGFARYLLSPVTAITFAVLITLGSLGFSVLEDLATERRWSRLSFHSQVVLAVTAALTLAGTAVVYFVEGANPHTLGDASVPERLLTAFFQAVSARTAGFSAIPAGLMAGPSLFAFLLLMFVGASPGSTGGGIKTTTAAILGAIVYSAVRGKRDVELGRYRVDRAAIDGSLVVAISAAAWVIAVTFVLLITERADFMTTLFEVVSAFGTAGLSLGLTESLSVAGKLVIAVTMFLGKVGPLALVLSLGGADRHGMTRLPEKRLIVG